MQKFVYKKIVELEKNNWWFKGRRKIIISFMQKFFRNQKKIKILDVGCGAGSVVDLLSPFGEVVGIDNYRPLVKYCQSQNKMVIHGDVNHLPFRNYSFDLVVALELLEHVKKDVSALKEIYRVLNKKGYLFLSVPAFKFLWGSHDLAANHYRRYLKKEINEKLIKAGFCIVKITYMNFFLFPLIAIFRVFKGKFSKLDPHLDSEYFSKLSLLSSFFSSILKIEGALFPLLNFPFGVTLICVAKKDENKRQKYN